MDLLRDIPQISSRAHMTRIYTVGRFGPVFGETSGVRGFQCI